MTVLWRPLPAIAVVENKLAQAASAASALAEPWKIQDSAFPAKAGNQDKRRSAEPWLPA